MTRHQRALVVGAGLAFATLCSAVSAEQNRYQAQVLVSDGFVARAPHTDPHLVNGWGVAFNPAGFVWVADNGTGLSTLYDGLGAPQSLVVAIPAAPGSTEHGKPTGIVFSGSADFVVSSGASSGPSRFIFATEDGLLAGWAPNVDFTHALQAYPKSGGTSTAVYKGLALAANSTGNHLYATDFVRGTVDVFDATFAKVSLAGAFADPKLPKDLSPFNIQNINGHLFVTYAKREPGEDDETAGKGLGAVNEFDADGRLIRRVATGGKLNAPWGVALAPDSGFGKLNSRLLVGQFGSGEIATFDLDHGNFHGMLNGSTGQPLAIEGLWALRFGNGAAAGPKTTLFFTAGIDDEEHGLFGAITPWSRGVDHDVTTSLLAPDNDGAGSTVSVESNNQNSTRVPLNVVTPIVLLPTDEDEQPAPKKRKAKEAREPREP